MPREIQDVLSYRSDLSTFLVHLTRERNGQLAKKNLISILDEWKLLAGDPMGTALQDLENAELSLEDQRVVCFTETPLEHVKLLKDEIEGRRCQFSSYGVAITKKQGRRNGVNPVWYLDSTPGRSWMVNEFNALVKIAIENPENLDLQRIFRLTPFIELMGKWPTLNSMKEFWWEREWRVLGDFSLPLQLIVFCPENDFREIRSHVRGLGRKASFLDPGWSLERMIAHLAGFSVEDTVHP